MSSQYKINGKVYIGSTSNKFNRRKYEHEYESLVNNSQKNIFIKQLENMVKKILFGKL